MEQVHWKTRNSMRLKEEIEKMARARNALYVVVSLMLVFATPNVALGAYVGSWFWQNPIPQGNDLRSVDFAGDTGWAVGEGVVLRTLNGGAQWAMQYGVPGVSERQFTRVTAVDSNTVWITASDGSVLCSTDGGATWEDRRPPGIANAWDIAFTDSSHGWLTDGYTSTWRTLDGGLTWAPVALPAMYGGGRFYQRGDRLLIAAGMDVCSVESSTGAVAKIGSVPSFGLTDIAFADDTHLVGVTDMGEFTRSNNGGVTWSAPRPVSRYAMDLSSVFFVSPKVGYTSSYRYVWKTTDGGATWTRFEPTIRDRSGTIVSTPLGAADVVAVPGRLFLVGSRGRIMYSLDSGASWRYISGDFFNDLVDVSFESTSSGVVIAENAAFATSDGGATWRRQAMPQVSAFDGISIAPNRKGWLTGTVRTTTSPYVAGVVFRTTDAGRTYRQQTIPKCIELLDVWTNDGVTAWAVGNSNVIFKTTDSGATWRKKSIDWTGVVFEYPDEHRPIKSVVVLANGLGYASATNEGYVLRTTDAGETWHPVPGVRKPGAVSMVGTGTVLVGGWDGVIRRNEYPSPNWTESVLPLNEGHMVQEISFLTPEVGYAACGNNLYKTEDGGRTWTRTWSGAWLSRIGTFGGTDAWGIGSGGTVLYNGGVLGDFTPPTTRTSAPAGWDDADYAFVSLNPTDQTGIDSTWWAIGEPSEQESTAAVLAASVTAYSDGLNYRPYRSRIKVSAEGITPITFYSRDANGNLERPRTVRVRLDRRAPVVNSNAKSSYGGSATVKVTATDVGSGVRTTYYSLDGGRRIARSGATAYVKAGLGSHSVTYWAVDRLGHVSTKVTKRFVVKRLATVGTPSAPATTTAGVEFTASGYLWPKHSLPARVLVRSYRWDSDTARWVDGPVATAYTKNNSVGSRYSVRLMLPSAGNWKIVAGHSDSLHYASYSPPRYTTCVEPPE